MKFSVLLTDADNFGDAFNDPTSGLIRLDDVSIDELDVLSRIIERSEGVLLAALPYREDDA